MSHTPGPWEIHPYADNEGDIHGGDGKLVCMMRQGDTDPEDDWSADARLIAAAPDLLAALKELVDDCDGLLGWNCDPAKRAIAKAEGRHHADA